MFRIGFWALAASLIALASSGCGGPDIAALPELPRPDLSRVDGLVREGLEAERATFDRQLAAGEVSADTFGGIAMLYHSNEQFPPAEVGYRNAVALSPESFRWHYYLADLLEAVGRRDDAVAQYERALTIDPDQLPTILRLAEFALEANDVARARQRFSRVVELDGRCVPAWIGLGNVALAEKDYATAVVRFERALEISPGSTVAHYPLGLAYRGLGETDKARSYLERRGNAMATVDNPLARKLAAQRLGWRKHQDQGIALAEAGRYDEALVAFQQAAIAAPQQTSVHVNTGSALTRLGRLDEAREAFERAVAIDPSDATAQFNLGTLAARAGDDERAVLHYESTLAAQPDYVEAHFNLANALRRVGRFGEAAEHYALVIDADPGNTMARLAELFSLAKLERWADALDRAALAHAALPDQAPIADALSRLLACAPGEGLRDGPRAKQLAQGLLDRQRSLSHVVSLAAANAEVGDFATAVELQSAAVSAVEGSAQKPLGPWMRHILSGYRNGQPCRQPWDPEGPELSPGR